MQTVSFLLLWSSPLETGPFYAAQICFLHDHTLREQVQFASPPSQGIGVSRLA